MSTNHTPGPWAVGKSFMWHKREFLTVHYDGKVKPAIAHVIDQFEGVGLDAQDRANARLIAAAPELLDALQELLAAERFSSRPPTTVMQAEAKLDRIRAAAAKAEAVISRALGQ